MKNDKLLTITSVLAIVLMSLHLTDDVVRGIEPGGLRRGAMVVADNIKFPGAPDYRAYMVENEGKRWRSVEHKTHFEYQSVIRDLVLVSTYRGDPRPLI